mmetsp:Transcript_11651/g.28277  ORF Transcript_11651/g.28277 Transcript_11651/m.28277 type:complete len:196 (+) Transcript_11651:146-733(+)
MPTMIPSSKDQNVGQQILSPPAQQHLTVSPTLDIKFHPVDDGAPFVPALTNSTDDELSGEEYFQEQDQEDPFLNMIPREPQEGLRAMVLDFATHPHLNLKSMPCFDGKDYPSCEQPSVILDNDTFSISDDESMGDCFEEEDYKAMASTMPSFPDEEPDCRTASVFRKPGQDAAVSSWPALVPARRTGGLFQQTQC